MKKFFAPCALALVVATSAQSPALPEPSPAPVVTSAYCPVTLSRVVQLDDGHTIAFGLRSLIGSGRASGKITAYAGDDRYTIPFKEKYAIDASDSTMVPNPIVVHFPHTVVITSAAVAFLDDPAPGPCTIVAPYIAPSTAKAGGHPVIPDSQAPSDQFVTASRLAEPMTAPDAENDPLPTCDQPYRSVRVARAMVPETPPAAQQQGVDGTVVVRVTIAESGALLSARIDKSASSLLNQASLFAARGSTYEPRLYRCLPIASEYLFVIEFTRVYKR